MDNEFRVALQAICGALPGALAVTLMGNDGIAVDTVYGTSSELEIPSLIIEYAALLDQARRSAQMFEAGGLQEMAIQSESMMAIIRPLTSEYFLALALEPDASAGRGRYLMRVHAHALTQALA